MSSSIRLRADEIQEKIMQAARERSRREHPEARARVAEIFERRRWESYWRREAGRL